MYLHRCVVEVDARNAPPARGLGQREVSLRCRWCATVKRSTSNHTAQGREHTYTCIMSSLRARLYFEVQQGFLFLLLHLSSRPEQTRWPKFISWQCVGAHVRACVCKASIASTFSRAHPLLVPAQAPQVSSGDGRVWWPCRVFAQDRGRPRVHVLLWPAV